MGLRLVKGRWYNMEKALQTTAIQSGCWHYYNKIISHHCRHKKRTILGNISDCVLLQNALTSLLTRLDWPKIVPQSVGNIASFVSEMASKEEKISVCAHIGVLIKKWLWKSWKISGCERTGHQKLCQQDCCHFFHTSFHTDHNLPPPPPLLQDSNSWMGSQI